MLLICRWPIDFFAILYARKRLTHLWRHFTNLVATLEVLKSQRPLVSDCNLLMDLGSGFASAGFLAPLPFARRLSGIAVKEVIHGAAGENKDVTDAHGSYFKSRLRDNVAHNLGDITSAQTLTASASLKPIKSSCTALIHYSPRAEDTLKPKGSNHFKGIWGFHSVQINSDNCELLCRRYSGIGTGHVFDKASVLGVFEGQVPESFNSLVSVIEFWTLALLFSLLVGLCCEPVAQANFYILISLAIRMTTFNRSNYWKLN